MTESGDFFLTKFIYETLPGDLSLPPLKCGGSTTVLPRRLQCATYLQEHPSTYNLCNTMKEKVQSV